MALENRLSISQILSRHALFRGLSSYELVRVAEGCRELRIDRNEVLFQRGDLPDGMHVVVTGKVKLAIPSAQGAEKVVHMCGIGSTFGEASVFLDKPYQVSAQATDESLLLLVSKQVLFDLIEASPLFSRKMLASLSMRVHELLDDMETCTLRSSVQRVVCFLVQLMPADGFSRQQVQLPTSKQTIASQLNLTPETLSRVLGRLSEHGLIQVNGRIITVPDRSLLQSFQA